MWCCSLFWSVSFEGPLRLAKMTTLSIDTGDLSVIQAVLDFVRGFDLSDCRLMQIGKFTGVRRDRTHHRCHNVTCAAKWCKMVYFQVTSADTTLSSRLNIQWSATASLVNREAALQARIAILHTHTHVYIYTYIHDMLWHDMILAYYIRLLDYIIYIMLHF
jgi:hypothetical protein